MTQATTTAPWWGVPVIAGGFLIIGAVLGWVGAWLQDWRKHRREDRTAHREVVRETMVELLAWIRKLQDAEHSPPSPEDEYYGPEHQRSKLVQEFRAMMQQSEVLKLLLRDDAPYESARLALMYTFDYAYEYAFEGPPPGRHHMTRDELHEMRKSTYDRFLEEARRVLAVQ